MDDGLLWHLEHDTEVGGVAEPTLDEMKVLFVKQCNETGLVRRAWCEADRRAEAFRTKAVAWAAAGMIATFVIGFVAARLL